MGVRIASPPSLASIAGLGLVLAVLILALLPNTGAIPADASCPYSSCNTGNNGSSAATPWYILLAVLVVIAAALGVLIVLRRRRGVGGSAPPVEEWSGPAAGAAAGPEGPTMPVEPLTPTPTAAAPPAAAGAAYLEGPEDVGHALPETPAAPEPAAKDESDIDSLMKELDKISGEILKKGKPKTPPPEDGESSG
jgi:hypothetical protein